jgi:predicted house-cleaning noncanonical NTP pyrophosphatase (MazG superfamily)
MTEFVWKSLKLLRDGYSDNGGEEVMIAPVAPEVRGRMLRAKLAEEVQEYLEDRTPEELVDIIEACIGLAFHEHDMVTDELVELGRRKRDEKGGFAECLGLFVKVPA